jgi:hypothetical protein
MELLRGIVHGRMIELENELGMPDGQSVTIVVQPAGADLPNHEKQSSDTGLRRGFGAWAEDADELDSYLQWNRQQRQVGRLEMEP